MTSLYIAIIINQAGWIAYVISLQHKNYHTRKRLATASVLRRIEGYCDNRHCTCIK